MAEPFEKQPLRNCEFFVALTQTLKPDFCKNNDLIIQSNKGAKEIERRLKEIITATHARTVLEITKNGNAHFHSIIKIDNSIVPEHRMCIDTVRDIGDFTVLYNNIFSKVLGISCIKPIYDIHNWLNYMFKETDITTHRINLVYAAKHNTRLKRPKTVNYYCIYDPVNEKHMKLLSIYLKAKLYESSEESREAAGDLDNIIEYSNNEDKYP